MARSRRQTRREVSEDEEEDDSRLQPETQGRDYQDDQEEEDAYGEDGDGQGQQLISQLAKKLVRYALSVESNRRAIKRQDVNRVVLGAHTREFKNVFSEAQLQLETVFGMKMVELPKQEKVTGAQKRAAAQKADKPGTSSTNTWILITTLDPRFRVPSILGPPKAPTRKAESEYVGLYSIIIALIYINGGVLPDTKLESHLKKLNAEVNTPIGRTEAVLQRMINDGYLVRSKDSSSGDEQIEYTVGPRGKIEVGEEGVAGVIRKMMGGQDPDIESKIQVTLSLNPKHAEPAITGASQAPKPRGRKRTHQQTEPEEAAEGQEEDEEEDEEDETEA
ncbi:MAGE-domain-containing protein [Microthyrium microscopicum]|uniref:MAGE-domain-containing protein n=1 Tax=Microthyrium microscopicum TaxID=703497 RepID=A0A6A6U8K5_9PEZI|nr:MAGE-domain-containing protein [Microthyrium microscopicum]